MVGPRPHRDHTLALLKNESVQNALADLVDKYWEGFQPVFRIATAEKNGVRPENVANEMFSCLHHVARGLSDVDTIIDSVAEIRKATESHVKRATLDSYKIAINSILEEDKILTSLLDYILLADDLAGSFKDRVENIKQIHKLKKKCKSAYVDAKKFEAAAKWSDAIEMYDTALKDALKIRTSLEILHEDPVTVAFLAREGRRIEERRRDKKFDLKKGVFIALVSSLLTGMIVSGFNYFNSNLIHTHPHDTPSSGKAK
ncbi:MAG: hypothetical protein HW380_190 [Magnetococcales bacterium]|nr:hypothetical protein [Magnetococcales bacterium]HIJ85637.1 hypothetical protein [Magnetococcales bacterium]